MARSIKRTQINDIGNLLIAGTYITIEANGRVSSSGGIAPNSNVEGNIRFTGSITANSYVASGFGVPTIESATNINLTANGTNGGAVVVTNSPIRLRSYTTVDRGNITASAGDLIFNSTEAMPQLYTGSAWGTIATVPPIFKVSAANTNTNLIRNSWTVISYDSKRWDSHNYFNTALNRFQPNIAGYYHLDAMVGMQPGSNVAGGAIIGIWKNGTDEVGLRGTRVGLNTQGGGTDLTSVVVSGDMYFNGSSDYADVRIVQSTGFSATVGNVAIEVSHGFGASFSGHYIRGV